MNNIISMNVINDSDIDRDDYFRSLICAAVDKNLIGEDVRIRIESESLLLLKEQVLLYLGADSSSVPTVVAEGIFESLCYTIGVYLKQFPHNVALKSVYQNNVNELYERGKKRVKMLLLSSKAIYNKLLKNLIITHNECYNLTLRDGLKGFFKMYSPNYNAQDKIITADYPVYNNIIDNDGIEFIHQYIKNIYYENKFCCYFDNLAIEMLLKAYSKDYKNLIINIYEIVLFCAIGCQIVNENIKKLLLDDKQIQQLCHIFKNKPVVKIRKLLIKSVKSICDKLSIDNNTKKYIITSTEKLSRTIYSAARHKIIANVFVNSNDINSDSSIIFSYGNKMNDYEYKKIIDMIISTDDRQQKVNIIKDKIKTLSDLGDVLLDCEFNNDEITSVLKILSFAEFSALAQRYIVPNEFDTTKNESQLSSCIKAYISTFPQNQQVLLYEAIKAIKED